LCFAISLSVVKLDSEIESESNSKFEPESGSIIVTAITVTIGTNAPKKQEIFWRG